jgi:cell division protein FtsI/penicillin-binding protein 2
MQSAHKTQSWQPKADKRQIPSPGTWTKSESVVQPKPRPLPSLTPRKEQVPPGNTGERAERPSPAQSTRRLEENTSGASANLHLGRLTFLKGLWILLACGMVAQLVNLQIFQSEGLTTRANDQQERRIVKPSRRGKVLDRNTVDLAVSLSATSIAVNPRRVKNRERLARRISRITGENPRRIATRLRRGRAFAWVARNVNSKTAERLLALDPMAMWALPANRREHPLSSVAGQLVGHVDIDDKGASGLEYRFNGHLSGHPGWSVSLVDAHGNRVPNTLQPTVAPVDGGNIRLTLDASYQGIVEYELTRAVDKWSATGGVAVLYDASTGAIRALANVPTYDPGKYASTSSYLRRNRAITDPYEPGSTFKAITAAIVLAEGRADPFEVIDCSGEFSGIGDAHSFTDLTFREVIEKSSNVGTAKLSMRLTERSFYRYLRKFGFGAETGVDLPGESKGILAKRSLWNRRTQPTIAIGQEIGVTVLQLAAAYGALANKGRLMTPYLVESFTNHDGSVSRRVSPREVREVVPGYIAEQMTELLCGVVERGTGGHARIDTLRVAGKTGTAQIARTDGRGYESGAYVASFVGFLPDMKPRLVCVVAITRPNPVHYGGTVAAPVFRNIMSRLLNRDADIMRDTDPFRKVVPLLTGLPVNRAITVLDSLGIGHRISGAGDVVIGQWPPATASVPQSNAVELHMADPDRLGPSVPNVRGNTVRGAMTMLSATGFRVRLIGSGTVVSQTPAPGSRRPADGLVTLHCRRPDHRKRVRSS